MVKLYEFESDPTSTIISVAEVIRLRAANSDAPAKMDVGTFLQMVNNAGHAKLDYSGLKAYFDAEPKLANVIQTFNDREIVFVGQGDEEDSAELTPPSGDVPPEEKVEKMAKRAMKARESVRESASASFKKMSDAKLKAWIKRNDTDEPDISPVFGQQIKAAKRELKARGLKLNENLNERDETYLEKEIAHLETEIEREESSEEPSKQQIAEWKRMIEELKTELNEGLNEFAESVARGLNRYHAKLKEKVELRGSWTVQTGNKTVAGLDSSQIMSFIKSKGGSSGDMLAVLDGKNVTFRGRTGASYKIMKESIELDEGKQKPYVSKDKDGAHVMNASGKIVKSFKDIDQANAYLKKNYNKLMKESIELDEWTISDVEAAMRKKYGKIDKEAIEKLRKVMFHGNVDRNDLVKVGHGKLLIGESIELKRYEKTVLRALKADGIGGYFSDGILYVAQRKLEDAIDAIKAAAHITVAPKIVGEDVELNEVDDNPVAQAVLRRLIRQHPDALGKYGPDKVMDAVDELASFVGDVEEIGSSDVSIWVNQVLKDLEASERPIGLKPNKAATDYMDQMDRAHDQIYNEGYYEMRPIDRERYTEMPDLEGPFMLRSGKVVYYDPKEGQYYDRDSDMYMSYEEYMQHDSPSMQEGYYGRKGKKKRKKRKKIKEVESSIMPARVHVFTRRNEFGVEEFVVKDQNGEEVMATQDEGDAMYLYDMLSRALDECPSPGVKKDYDPGPKDPYRWIRELVPSHWAKS